ncbi:MAG: hypothetical protein FWC64_01530 [Treponema sp.]|nr:hypothetical protein [Treponema sp.]
MEIQGLSTGMSGGYIQEAAAVQVQAMTVQSARDTAEDLARVMGSAEFITDPSRGNFLDMTA